MTSALVHYFCTQSCPLWWLRTMMHWGRLTDGWINRDRLLTHHMPSAISLSLALSVAIVFSHPILLLLFFLYIFELQFLFVLLHSLPPSWFNFLQLLFRTYISPSTLFLSSSFLCDPLYDVISTRACRVCGEHLCHAHPHSSWWVGRMRRMELREYVWPPPPPQMKCTQSHTVISVHCMAWIQRAGQFHDYAKGNV